MAPLLRPWEACGTQASVLDTAGIQAGQPLRVGSLGSAQLRQHPWPCPPGALSACPHPSCEDKRCLQTLPRSLARGTLLPYRPAASGPLASPCFLPPPSTFSSPPRPSPPLRPSAPCSWGQVWGGSCPPSRGGPSTPHPLYPDPCGGLRIKSTRRNSRDCCVRSPPSAFSDSLHVSLHIFTKFSSPRQHPPTTASGESSWPTARGAGQLSLLGLQAPRLSCDLSSLIR